jgi:hypothetical protein
MMSVGTRTRTVEPYENAYNGVRGGRAGGDADARRGRVRLVVELCADAGDGVVR